MWALLSAIQMQDEELNLLNKKTSLGYKAGLRMGLTSPAANNAKQHKNSQICELGPKGYLHWSKIKNKIPNTTNFNLPSSN